MDIYSSGSKGTICIVFPVEAYGYGQRYGLWFSNTRFCVDTSDGDINRNRLQMIQEDNLVGYFFWYKKDKVAIVMLKKLDHFSLVCVLIQWHSKFVQMTTNSELE